jgi:hypothetical protein
MRGHLQILHKISGVWTSTPTAILLVELGIKALPYKWLHRAAKFWNNLAALPPGSIYRCMALESCQSAIGPQDSRNNWTGSMYSIILGTSYQPGIRMDDMDVIDITALNCFITQQREAVLTGLNSCLRTCPSTGACFCKYAAWFAQPPHKHARSLLDIPLPSKCLESFLRFRMGVHRLSTDAGSWKGVPRQDRVCQLCASGSLCDEKMWSLSVQLFRFSVSITLLYLWKHVQ